MHPYTIGVLLGVVASAQGAQINTRRYRHYPPIRLSNSDARTIRGPKRRGRELRDANIAEVSNDLNLEEVEFSNDLSVEVEFSIPLVLEQAEFSVMELSEMSMPSSTEDEAGSLDSEKITVQLGGEDPLASKVAATAGAAAGAGLLVAFAAGGFLKLRRKRNADNDDEEEDGSVVDHEEEDDQSRELRLGIYPSDDSLRIDTSVFV